MKSVTIVPLGSWLGHGAVRRHDSNLRAGKADGSDHASASAPCYTEGRRVVITSQAAGHEAKRACGRPGCRRAVVSVTPGLLSFGFQLQSKSFSRAVFDSTYFTMLLRCAS